MIASADLPSQSGDLESLAALLQVNSAREFGLPMQRSERELRDELKKSSRSSERRVSEDWILCC